MHVPLSQPDITNCEIKEVIKVLRSKRLALGRYTEKFEQAVAKFVGAKYAVAISSGTAGLHLLMRAFGIKDTDEVITTPFSFIASSNCILYEHAKPVFVDIEQETLCIDPAKIEEKITQKTKAIIAVDIFGHPCRWDALTKIAKKHNILLIDDACEALGSVYKLKKIGQWADATVFAFYPNKQITTGEGGMIVTNNVRIARFCKALRNHGRLHSKWLQHDLLGYNYRIDEMSAALGFVQMQRIHTLLKKRERVAKWYARELHQMNRELRAQNISPTAIPTAYRNTRVSWFVYVIQLSQKYTKAKRDTIIRQLAQKGIACSNYFPSIHLQTPYKKLGYKKGSFPITESVASHTIALPFFNDLKKHTIKQIITVLKKLLTIT